MQPAQIHYLEGKGQQAQSVLLAFLQQLGGQPGLLGAYLLASPAQPNLWLVESHWANQVPALDIPEGCKQWSFEVRAALGESA